MGTVWRMVAAGRLDFVARQHGAGRDVDDVSEGLRAKHPLLLQRVRVGRGVSLGRRLLFSHFLSRWLIPWIWEDLKTKFFARQFVLDLRRWIAAMFMYSFKRTWYWAGWLAFANGVR